MWYLVAVKSCGYYTTRGYLSSMCLKLELTTPTNGSAWYVNLWKWQGNRTQAQETRLAPHVEGIMIGHLVVQNAGMALRKQTLKLERVQPGFASRELLDNLRELILFGSRVPLHITPYSVNVSCFKLIRCSALCLGQVTDIALKLHPQLANSSAVICIEKDRSNHCFQRFFDAYAIAMAILNTNEYTELSWSSVVVWPYSHILRFINHLCLNPWLPAPKLYSLQVRSELEFQLKALIDNTNLSLDRIDASTAAYSKSLSHLADITTSAIDRYQASLTQLITDAWARHPLHRWLPKFISSTPEDIQTLQRHHALGDRMRNRIAKVEHANKVHWSHTTQLRGEVQKLSKVFKSTTAYDWGFDSLRAPFPFAIAGVERPNLSSSHHDQHRDLLRRHHQRNADNTSTVTIFDLHHHILATLSPFDLHKIKTGIVGACRRRPPFLEQPVAAPPVQQMICTVLDILELDDELLLDDAGGVQKSWVRARTQAMGRFQKGVGADEGSVGEMAVKLLEDWEVGRVLPDFL